MEVSPSIAGSLFSALDYLTSYPYGCTEQTMSSYLPNVIVAETLKQIECEQAEWTTPTCAQRCRPGSTG